MIKHKKKTHVGSGKSVVGTKKGLKKEKQRIKRTCKKQENPFWGFSRLSWHHGK